MAWASIGQAAIGALLGIRQPCRIRGVVNTVQSVLVAYLGFVKGGPPVPSLPVPSSPAQYPSIFPSFHFLALYPFLPHPIPF
jgi:hypothetical protein